MTTIYKYELELKQLQEIKGPPMEFLSVQIQNEKIVFWAAVHPEVEPVTTAFKIVGTGHPFPDRSAWYYIGTVQLENFVWHIFSKRIR